MNAAAKVTAEHAMAILAAAIAATNLRLPTGSIGGS
jgi:hypothetical protein